MQFTQEDVHLFRLNPLKESKGHNIRASGECYQHCDRVYYKRDDDNKRKGPGTVIGQVVFVRHGSIYVRVHPCRLIRCGLEGQEDMMKESQTESGDTQQQRGKRYESHDSDWENTDDLQAEKD